MKSFEDALAFMKEWDGTLDGRDIARFAEFVPVNNLAEAGIELQDGVSLEDWGPVKPWTEEEVLKQLKADAEFGLEKAQNGRGLSTAFMFQTVNMWCHLLENNLERSHYDNYAIEFFESILTHYGWLEPTAS